MATATTSKTSKTAPKSSDNPQWLALDAHEAREFKRFDFVVNTRREFEQSVKSDSGAAIWSTSDIVLPYNAVDADALESVNDFAQQYGKKVRSIRFVGFPCESESEPARTYLKTATAEDVLALLDGAEFYSDQPIKADDSNEPEPESKLSWFPKPDDKIFHGLAGDFVRLVEPHTEGDPVGLLIQFMTAFGNLAGRNAYYQVEGDKHYLNIFAALVGQTGAARKGTSWGRVKQVFKGIDPEWEKQELSGLSSGEGLIHAVRDAVETTRTDKKGVVSTEITDAGVEDKRCLVYEGEFAQVLRNQGREGNNLSTVIRNLWDTGNARSATKNSPIRATNAHVSMIGHITPSELIASLGEVETANGYANRFLWCAVKRSKILPFGGDLDDRALEPIRQRLVAAYVYAQPTERMLFTDTAKKIWIKEYYRLETTRTGAFAGMTQRATPYVIRLACLYALLDTRDEIDAVHLEAALALWKYCEDSVHFVFNARTGDKSADILFEALQTAGKAGLTRTQINHQVFKKNKKAEEIEALLRLLNSQGLADYRMESSGAPRPVQVWFAALSYNAQDIIDAFDAIDVQDVVQNVVTNDFTNDFTNYKENNDLTSDEQSKVVKVVKVVTSEISTPSPAQNGNGHTRAKHDFWMNEPDFPPFQPNDTG